MLSPQQQESVRAITARIKEHFPFLRKSQFDAFQRKARRMVTAKNERLFFLQLERWIASLHNSHTRVGAHPAKQWYGPSDASAQWIAGRPYLFRKQALLGCILSVDGKTAERIVQCHASRMSGSPQFVRHQAQKFLLCSQFPRAAQIVMQQGKRRYRLRILRRRKRGHSAQQLANFRIVNGTIGSARLPTFAANQENVSTLRAIVHRIHAAKPSVLLLDLRGNNGGSGNVAAEFAGHFFRKSAVFGHVVERAAERTIQLKKRMLRVRPQKPFFTMPLMLLMDVECFSTTEYFIAGLKDDQRAITVGETTGGGSGNPKKFIVPYGKKSFELFVSTWRYYRPNGKPLEGVGIKPDIEVRPTLRDIRGGRDTVFEAAFKKAQEMQREKSSVLR